MRREPGLERIVASWLKQDGHEDADRVLFTVLNQLDTTPQRRAGWLARRLSIMNNNTVRYSMAAAVVVIAALVGVRYLTPDVGGPGATATPTAEPTPSATPMPLGSRDPLPPGRYAVPGFSADITVGISDDGWSSNDGWVLIGPRLNEEPDGMAIRFYTASGIYENPASTLDGPLDPGPSVDDLVEAIIDNPAWEASGPTDITIDGHSGQMVQLTIPDDAEMTYDDRFLIFGEPTGGGQVYGWAAGQTFDLYIVDVDGERVIVDAFHYRNTPDEDLAAQRAVVDSIRFGS